MGEFKDLAVEGAVIAAMPTVKRWSRIIKPAPNYEIVKDLDDPTKKVEKLIMNVRLSNGSPAKYFPNMTSARLVANELGTDFEKWVDKIIIWGRIADQNVKGQAKKVLYITEVK